MQSSPSHPFSAKGHMMRSWILCAIAAALLALPIDSASASYPSYLILRTPRSHKRHDPHRGHYPGYGYGVTTSTYAYGWFGVTPRRHWSRHFGYYRNFTQWSAR